MRKALILSAIVLVASAAIAQTRGAWHVTAGDDGKLHLDISRGNSMHWGQSMDLAAFSGLSSQTMAAKAETPVKFEMVRDAGTIHFTGTFTDGDGVGRFTFEPNRNYASTLRSLGVSGTIDDDDDLFALAMHDVSTAFIREMQSLGLRENLDQYIAFRIHGVSAQFVRDLRALGYDALSADDLVSMRIHGVSPRFIRELKDAGYSGIPVEKLVEMRIHGISADDVKRMK